MGILDAIKGIAGLPGKLNEARFNHATVMVPIGKDPDTGEDITIPADQLQGAGYDPASGQIYQPQQVRTGQSKFGRFLSQGLPRMLDAGIAAATSPGNGEGGFLAGLRGMDIGRDRLQRRDIMAYQMQRQRQQDAIAEQERQSRIAENAAQAQWYRRRAEADNSKPASTPSTWEAMLVKRWNEATDMDEKNAIADQLNQMRMGSKAQGLQVVGGHIYDTNSGQWISPPEKPQQKKTPQVRGRVWADANDAPGYEDEYYDIFDPNESKGSRQLIEGSRRKKVVKAPTSRRGPTRTPAQADAAAADATANKYMAAAGQDYDKALAMARQDNASLAVQDRIVKSKKASTPPVPRGGGSPASGVNLGGGQAWKRTKAFGGK